ncbi:MAG: hypothetical protein WBE40_07755 [Thermoplasmata archaeon]
MTAEITVSAQPDQSADFGPTTPGTRSSGLKEALDSLAGKGGKVRLRPGLFVTDVPLCLPMHVTLEGAGYEKTNDRFSAIEASAQFPSGVGLLSGPPATSGSHSRAIHVRDLSLLRVARADGPVIDFTNVDHSTIERVETQGGTVGILLGWNGPPNPDGADAPGEVRGQTIRVVNASSDGIFWKYRTQELWDRVEILGRRVPPQNALHFFGSNKVQVSVAQLTQYTRAGVLFESDGSPPNIGCVVTNLFANTRNGGTDIVEQGPSRACGVFGGAALSPSPFQTRGGLWIRNVRGVNDLGMIPTMTPPLPAIGAPVQNRLPFPVEVYAAGGSVERVEVLDNAAKVAPTLILGRPAPLQGHIATVNPGESVRVIGSAPPTWWAWRAT